LSDTALIPARVTCSQQEEIMAADKRTPYELREAILKLLSDDEIAKVSTEEGERRLTDGDEYVDLDKLEDGVSTADGEPVAIGRVLARVDVQPETWSEILAKLKKSEQS
jgi:hypothetical protein